MEGPFNRVKIYKMELHNPFKRSHNFKHNNGVENHGDVKVKVNPVENRMVEIPLCNSNIGSGFFSKDNVKQKVRTKVF